MNTQDAGYANYVGGKLHVAMLGRTYLVANNALKKVPIGRSKKRTNRKDTNEARVKVVAKSVKNVETRLRWREDFYCTTTP